jgi:hypothetical protein
VVLFVALAALAACARCGGTAGPPPERFVPADALAAAVVPEIRGAVRSLAEFYATAEDFPGTSDLPSLRASLSAQLGFDPFNLAALREAGIDARRGMAVFLDPDVGAGALGPPSPILVLPISNHAAADALLRRIAAERFGADERTVHVVGPSQVVVHTRRGSTRPLLTVGEGDGTVVLCAGAKGPEGVARALSAAVQGSLADTAAWRVAREVAGPDAAVIGIVPPASKAAAEQWLIRDGVALALAAEARQLHARLVLLLGDREPSFRALEAEGSAGGELAAHLDPAASLVGRWDGDPAPLGAKLVPILPAPDRARLAKGGIDLERDLFGALAPGAAAAVSLPPRIDLPALDAQSLRRDPFRLVQFEAVLPLRDPARAAVLSERIAKLAGQRPARGAPFALPTASGELAWAVDGDRLLLAGGAKGRLAVLRGRLAAAAGGYRAPTDLARQALEAGGLGALVLDTRNFVASVRALPPEAFGSGPTGFVMRSLVARFVDPAERIDAASLRAGLAPGALIVALDVESRAAQERAP